MSGGWLHGEHERRSNMCRGLGEGHLLPSCVTSGVSTLGGGPKLLNWAEAGVAGVRPLCSTGSEGASGWIEHLLEEAAPSEHLAALPLLTDVTCLFGVSEFCAAVFLVVRGWWGWFNLDLNVNEGNLHALFLLSRMLVADWHLLLPRLAGAAAAAEVWNCGLTWNMKTVTTTKPCCSYSASIWSNNQAYPWPKRCRVRVWPVSKEVFRVEGRSDFRRILHPGATQWPFQELQRRFLRLHFTGH